MNQKEIDMLYEKSKPLIFNAMKKVLKKNYELTKDEIEFEANMIFCGCADRYDPKKGPFENFLITNLYFGLYRKCRELKGDKRIAENHNIEWRNLDTFPIDEYYQEYVRTPDVNEIISASLANMSNDAQQIAEIVFDPPDCVLERSEGEVYKRFCKKDIFDYLRSKGWRIKRINKGFWEIKETLHLVWV